jgi:hypothetical protein
MTPRMEDRLNFQLNRVIDGAALGRERIVGAVVLVSRLPMHVPPRRGDGRSGGVCPIGRDAANASLREKHRSLPFPA